MFNRANFPSTPYSGPGKMARMGTSQQEGTSANTLDGRVSGVDREKGLALLRTMLVIRRCEERLAKSHQHGLIFGACHTYVGQEAVATGVCSHLESSDPIFSTHRGHGHALAKGLDPKHLISELYGRSAGVSRGRGGSMHLFAPEIGMMGTSGIVGPCILQAAGGGYSAKLLDNQGVAVAFFGDGAVNNGAFHEGINMAAIWKLPVLFVCENNLFATEVSFEYACAGATVAGKAAGYGIPGVEVDGNDVLAVRKAAGEAVQRARAGQGPTLLECRTYRTRAHAEGMVDAGYRNRDEVEEWKTRDPIQRFAAYLVEHNGVDAEEIDALRSSITRDIEEAHTFAESGDWPSPEIATRHVYAATPGGGESKPAIQRLDYVADAPENGREITYMQATHEALSEEMANDPSIFVMGEGIGKRGGNFATTTGMYEKYGSIRLCDTPICERGFVGLAAGAAMTGTRPIIDFMFIDFILDATGEIINQIAKMQYMSSGRLKMPVILRGCYGIGHSAATHHSGSYYQMYSQIPGLRVVVPSTPFDAKGLFARALRGDDPVMFLEHREILSMKGPVPEAPYEIEFGKAAVAARGSDVTVVAFGLMRYKVLEARAKLLQEGISVEVVDPRTLSPLDTDTILESVAGTGRLLIVDETPASCGVGAEIAARICDKGFDELDAPIRRLNGLFTPTPYSPTLEAAIVPQVDDIMNSVRELLDE